MKGLHQSVERKTWKEFKSSCMFYYINNILDIFGWSLFCETNEETKEIINVFPVKKKKNRWDEVSEATRLKRLQERAADFPDERFH